MDNIKKIKAQYELYLKNRQIVRHKDISLNEVYKMLLKHQQ